MPYRKIDIAASTDSYKAGTSAKATKWRDNFLATVGIAAAAASDEAQADYVSAVMNPGIQAKRQKKLRGLSDEDFKAPVRTGGAAIYSSAAGTKAPKWGKAFTPYAAAIDAIVPTLPPPVDDVDANIDNRAKPIARRLRALSREASSS